MTILTFWAILVTIWNHQNINLPKTWMLFLCCLEKSGIIDFRYTNTERIDFIKVCFPLIHTLEKAKCFYCNFRCKAFLDFLLPLILHWSQTSMGLMKVRRLIHTPRSSVSARAICGVYKLMFAFRSSWQKRKTVNCCLRSSSHYYLTINYDFCLDKL